MERNTAPLKARYPGREAQIDQLAAQLTCSGSALSPLFVSGPASAGKTAVVREVMAALGLRHAYVNCTEAPRTKPLLSSILHQLKGGKRRREDGYDSSARCDSLNDFLQALPGVAARHAGPAWVVLDNAQRLAGTDLLTALMRLRDAPGANVGLLMHSAVPWDSGRFSCGSHNVLPPINVPFPAYRHEQIVKILELELPGGDAAHAQAHRQFLRLSVPALCRATNNLLDLRAAAAALWPKYSAPLREGRHPGAAALAGRIKADLQRMTSELDVAPAAAAPAAAAVVVGEREDGGAADLRASSRGLAFELPYMSKYLLLAAYIASRNKPTSDRAVFDPTYSRRGRRDSQATDRLAEAAIEAGLRGPHAFPLERLLHIFYCVYAQREEREEEERGSGQAGRSAAAAAALAHEVQVAEVEMQLSTLVALRLLSVSTGDPLEGGAYRCHVGDDVARAIADNVRLRLGDFLKLA